MLPMMEIVLPQPNAGQGNVAAFLAKLWKMVDDPETNHLISWSDEGSSFVIHHQSEFSQSLLPYYYKHSNMASFVRQLNMYGFHKVVGVDSGGLKSERQEEMEFAHPFFLRGMEHLLEKIKRKVSARNQPVAGQPGGQNPFPPAMRSEKVTEVLNEVSQIKDKQEDLDGRFDTMKKENEALWREVVTLRQKHQSQQKIVNKLIQFLVSMVQPRMAGQSALKRRYPAAGSHLAIEDGMATANQSLDMLYEASPSKVAKFKQEGPVISEIHEDGEAAAASSNVGTAGDVEDISDLISFDSSTGATVELPKSPGVKNVVSVNKNKGLTNKSNIIVTSSTAGINRNRGVGLARPASALVISKGNNAAQTTAATSPMTNIMTPVNPSLVTQQQTQQQHEEQQQQQEKETTASKSLVPSTPTTLATAPAFRPTLNREISREEVDMDVGSLTKDLDSLGDLLSGQITFDSNLLSTLFNPDEPFSSPSLGLGDFYGAGNNQAGGNLAITSSTEPSLFEMPDLSDNMTSIGGTSGTNSIVTTNADNGKNEDDDYGDLNTPLVFPTESPFARH